jgi:hypothetical protein
LVFNDGVDATLNFRPWLKGPVFQPLNDLDYFRRFFVDGGTVAWPNGADIAPETLHAQALRTRPNQRLQLTRARPASKKPRRRGARPRS